MKASQRDFFRTVRETILSNPFGRSRQQLDLQATGLPDDTPAPDILRRLVEKVSQAITAVETDKSDLSGEDRLLLRHAKLFHLFHIFCDAIDAHIQEQVNKEDPCPLKETAQLLKRLAAYGFGESESTRLVGLFFQMRRAYFFISRIVGDSTVVMNLRRNLWNNIFTGDLQLYDDYLWDRMEDFSTMILGETGTGKGMAAAAIGRSGFIPFNPRTGKFSESFARAFISINLSEFPEQLIESELFGHRKGAFTGAIESHSGVFSRCSPCGAIFLDELGDVTVPVQIKLLQVLQARTFTPVGSHRMEKFKGRVIGATNRDLGKLRKEGEFRDDFYYRLCSDVIEVPPLRQRLLENPQELHQLLAVTIRRIVGKDSEELTSQIKQIIVSSQPPDYAWPGNIRELEQCARRILLNGSYRWQQEAPLPTGSLPLQIINEELTAQELLSAYCRSLYERHGTYGAVARVTGLDRRTVKRHIESQTEDER